MQRISFLNLLNHYQTSLPDEQLMHEQIVHFVESNPNCFKRENAEGHITASVWIVNPDYTRVLMVLHTKIGLWLQPGGHCDGDSDVLAVAKKELEEETGLRNYEIEESIFDVDIHEIQAYKNDPAHLHYDIRFLTLADDSQEFIISEESRDLQWFSLDEAMQKNAKRSIVRMIEKTKSLQNQISF